MACPAFVSAQTADPHCYSRIYSEFSGSDIYHYYQDGEFQRYLIAAKALFGYTAVTGTDSIKVVYQRGAIQGGYSQLSEADDHLELDLPLTRLSIAPSWSIGSYQLSPEFTVGDAFGFNLSAELPHTHSLCSLSLGTIQQQARISYQVGSESGSIPFAWNLATARLSRSRIKGKQSLSIFGIYPGREDSLFDNRIFALGALYQHERKLRNNVSARLASFVGWTSARLNYRNEEYGKVDNLAMAYLSLGVDKHSPHFRLSAKLSSCLTGSSDDSYFDIWPFTFWDTFLASRTRLKKLEMYLISPELSCTWNWKEAPVTGWDASLGVTYNHLYHHEDVIHKNRIVLLYPFFYGYETFRYDWHEEVDACLRIPIRVCYKLPRGQIAINLQQVIPFRWSKLFSDGGPTIPGEPGPDKAWEWGGTSCVLQLSILL